MLNDREEKYEGQDESEYHFSDEEVSYDVETESPKPVVATEQKENLLNRLTRSKRMLISLGVFLVLIFVVYKMVAPGTQTTAPATDITPVMSATVPQSEKIQQPPVIPVAQTPPSVAQPASQPATQVAQVQPPAQTLPAPTNVPAPVSTVSTPVAVQSQPPQTMTPPPSPVAQAEMNMVQPGATMPVIPPPAPQQQPQVQPMAQAPTSSALQAQMPQGAAAPGQPSQPMPQAQMSPVPTQTISNVTALGSQITGGVETRMATMSAESSRLIGQLQYDYAQKFNEYTAQNKALQDQLQMLSTKVSSMENQMSQLIQTLSRQANQNNAAQGGAPAPQAAQPQIAAPEPRIAYNVQAIIPGRAWLRSDSGETLTVAEGDVIKDVGRVTKIDPYDGIVEINTGSRMVSLSYGNGG